MPYKDILGIDPIVPRYAILILYFVIFFFFVVQYKSFSKTTFSFIDKGADSCVIWYVFYIVDVISETGSTEGIDYSQRSSSFHHSRSQATNIAPPKHHSLPSRGKESGGGQTETLKSSQQNMFTSSPLYVNINDLTYSNSNSSIATSEGQDNHVDDDDDDDDDDDIHPLREGEEWKAFTSIRSDSIIAIEAPPRVVKRQPISEDNKENNSEAADQDAQNDNILNFCADEIAAGAAGSSFSTPMGTPSISPSHTPTLTRTPTPQGLTAHIGPIHPVAMPKNSGNPTQFIDQVTWADLGTG